MISADHRGVVAEVKRVGVAALVIKVDDRVGEHESTDVGRAAVFSTAKVAGGQVETASQLVRPARAWAPAPADGHELRMPEVLDDWVSVEPDSGVRAIIVLARYLVSSADLAAVGCIEIETAQQGIAVAVEVCQENDSPRYCAQFRCRYRQRRNC